MFVDDFDGETIINSQEELIEIIKKRPALDSNHFIFTFAEDGFPQLAAFVRNDDCVLYYLDKGGSFASAGKNKTGAEIFYENKTGAEVELARGMIVPAERLTYCAAEYFATRERPQCIEWMSL
jgi:hypothetical protein